MNRFEVVKIKNNEYYSLVDSATKEELVHLTVEKNPFNRHNRNITSFPYEGSIYYLCDFITSTRHRGNGYGRKLLNYVVENTKGKFIYLIVCSSSKHMGNRALVNFYKSVGFKVHNKKFGLYKYLTWMVLDNR